MTPEQSTEITLPCKECQAGVMHRKFVTYITYMADELVSVPDFPAWVCDVCGRREYDAQALTRLSLLLSPHAGKSTIRHTRPTRQTPQKPKPSRTAKPD